MRSACRPHRRPVSPPPPTCAGMSSKDPAMDQDHPTLEQLEAAASRLRRNERAVLELAARDSLSNVAIAERLGMPVHVAERLLACALRKLDRALARL